MLQSEADFARIIVGGRWLVNGQYLTTRLRQPNFNPAMGKTTKTTLWVRLSSLPLDYYGQEILTRIGNHLWKFLKIDARKLMLVCESLCESEYLTTPCTCCLYRQVPYAVSPKGVAFHFCCGLIGYTLSSCPKEKISFRVESFSFVCK